MAFISNAEMVRHYCGELLADGRDHTAPEIRAYINEQTGGQGVDGPLPVQTLYSVLAHSFERTGWGVYRMPADEVRQDVPPLTETEKLLCGLDRVQESLSEAFTRSYCELPITGEALLELHSIVQQMCSLIQRARELAKQETPIMEREQLAASTPPDQGEAAEDLGQGEPERWPRMGMTL